MRIIASAPWLSHFIAMGSSLPVTSLSRRRSQMASFAPVAVAIYSASVVERETEGCRLLSQDTAAPLTVMT